MRVTSDGNYAVRLRKNDNHPLTELEAAIALTTPGSEEGKLKYVTFSDRVISTFANSVEVANILPENGLVYIYRVRPVNGDISFRLDDNGRLESSTDFYVYDDTNYKPYASSIKRKENTILTTVVRPGDV